MQSYEFVPSPSEHGLVQVLQDARDTLFIASPYIKDYGVEVVLKNTQSKNLRLLTNLDMGNVTGTGFDIAAVLKLWDKFELKVSSLGKLHAKIYAADKRIAFVTSANLTRGGLRENYEYGVILRDVTVLSALLQDANAYFNLGNIFDREMVENIWVDVQEIRDLQRKLEKSMEAKRLRKTLREKEEALETKILTNRTKGKTVNAVFSETIEYLLRSRGLLSTQEIHQFMQDIHPDICDDTIDRVINGQHFGKKWKHMVRNAQQHLKQSGEIYLQEGKWRLSA